MSYKYSVDDRLYDNEIKYFIKNSPILRKIRINGVVWGLIAGTILMIVLCIKSINEAQYNEDVIYIILQYIIVYIVGVTIILVFSKFYLKFKARKTLSKYWKENYVHNLEVEGEKIYYSGFNNKKIELNNSNLKEVMDLGNIWGILVIGKKKSCSMILIPKNIFESKESLSMFKTILENKLEK